MTTRRLLVSVLTVATVRMSAAAQASTQAPHADSAYFRSDWATALTGYEALVRQDSTNPVAWFRIGVAEHGLGRFGDALEALGKAKRFGFQPLAVYLRLARTYARLGDQERALAYADSVVSSGGGAPPSSFADEQDFSTIRNTPRFAALVKRVANSRYPCRERPEAHQFDFWIGQWDVAPWAQPNAARAAAGVNDVRGDLEQCLIVENWHGAGGGYGKSFNIFDTNIHMWRQVWMSDGGGALDYTGEYRDGAMRFSGWTAGPDGGRVLQKLTFTPYGRDTVRQTFEVSRDSGKTWVVTFDGRYVRRAP